MGFVPKWVFVYFGDKLKLTEKLQVQCTVLFILSQLREVTNIMFLTLIYFSVYFLKARVFSCIITTPSSK